MGEDENSHSISRPLTNSNGADIASDAEVSQSPTENVDAGGWGTSKKDYYNADVIETEADALEEEAEARRLEQQYLHGMTEADFGYDEIDWLDANEDGDKSWEVARGDSNRVVSEILPQQEIVDAMGPEERLEILRTRYPEFEPLAKEFLDLQALHEDLSLAAAAASKMNGDTAVGSTQFPDKLPIAAIKYSALSAYLAALSMYFALLTSAAKTSDGKVAAMSPHELQDHTIMDSLVHCRELWGKAQNLSIPEPTTPETTSIDALGAVEHNQAARANAANVPTTKPKPKKRKSKAERAAAVAQEKERSRRQERLKETEASLASLSDLAKRASNPIKATPQMLQDGSDSDFGDPTHLAAHEAAQKAARKKSLKFYTSQIVSKQEKRGAAGRDAGGDADLPYKERLKDRQERLNSQAEKRGKTNRLSKEEALGGESDEEDVNAARTLRDDGDDSYYDLVAGKASSKKAAKVRFAAEQAAAAKELACIPHEDLEGEDGKRAISYAIEKNKGLHAKRKKEVRNPRVKKRKKFEEKKKRLGSVRQVYKGGEGKGYQGELTGIKGNLVRSVKL